MHAENQDAHARGTADDLPRGLDAVEQRHPDVENGHIGIELDSLAYRIASVARLRNHAPVTAILENLSQALTQDCVVIAEQHAKFIHDSPPDPSAMRRVANRDPTIAAVRLRAVRLQCASPGAACCRCAPCRAAL